MNKSSITALSGDVVGELSRFLPVEDLYRLYEVCPAHMRPNVASSVRFISYDHPHNHATGDAPPWPISLLKTLPRWWHLQTLHISHSSMSGIRHDFSLPENFLFSLPPTLCRLKLAIRDVMECFLAPDSPTTLEAVSWLPIHSILPNLSHLTLKNHGILPLFELRLKHILEFLAVLPQTLLTLRWCHFPLFSLDCLRALPPTLEYFETFPLTRDHRPYFTDEETAFTEESALALPPNLTKLRARTSMTDAISSEFIALLPKTLLHFDASVQTSVTLSLPADLMFPSHLVTLNIRSNQEILGMLHLEFLPPQLKYLRITQWGWTFPVSMISKLPRSLISLELRTGPLMEASTEEILFPPLLTNLYLPSSGLIPWDILPRTLQSFESGLGIIGRLRQLGDPFSLPSGLTRLHISDERIFSVEHLKFLKNLRILALGYGGVSDECLDFDILPPNLVSLVTKSILASGRFIPNDVQHVDREIVITSVKHRMRTLMAQKRGLLLQTDEVKIDGLSYCPEAAISFKDVSIEHVPVEALPRYLKMIHMPYHISQEDVLKLPPVLTQLNATCSLPFSTLRLLPPTVTTLKRSTIILDLDPAELANLEYTNAISLPSSFFDAARTLFPRITFVVTWKLPFITRAILAALPDTYNSLNVQQECNFAPAPEFDCSALDELPASLTKVSIDSIEFSDLFSEYLNKSPRLHDISTFSYNLRLRDASVPLALPKHATSVSIRSATQTTMLPAVWPQRLDSLSIFQLPIAFLKHLPSQLRTLVLSCDSLLVDSDMAHLPRSLTSLTLSSVRLSKACLNTLPPDLVYISLPKPMFPVVTILKVLKERRESGPQPSCGSS